MPKESVQPEINIGLVGHVDHGKTTLVKALSGIWTDTHSEEIKRGITIRLGYANAEFRVCKKCKIYTTSEKCSKCKAKTGVTRKVSFVDAPGHESLMATMLSGAAIMDGALLLVAANETCPQPQTKEHLMALNICGIKNIVIVQNKIDLVSEDAAIKNHGQIRQFIKGTEFEKCPIIPVSARFSINLDCLIEAIEKHIPTPKHDSGKDPIMFVARSFDINKPGAKIESLVGGVLGGSLKQGMLKTDDKIELRPGRMVIEKNKKVWKPIATTIASLMTGTQKIKQAGPGGSIGILTLLDPSIVKSDSLTGSIAGLPGKLPKTWDDLALETHLLERVVGAAEELVVSPIKKDEILMLNVNSASTVGIVYELGKNKVKCKLKLPVCAEPGSRATISRRVGTRFRLIGYGVIKE